MKTYSRHDFTREERAARAKVAISAAFESKEQAFLDFVLSHYVRVGCRGPERVDGQLRPSRSDQGPQLTNWPLYNLSSETYVTFGTTTSTEDGWRDADCDFWDATVPVPYVYTPQGASLLCAAGTGPVNSRRWRRG